MAVVVEIVVQEEVEAVCVTLTKRENATEVQPVDLPINSVSIRAEIKISQPNSPQERNPSGAFPRVTFS